MNTIKRYYVKTIKLLLADPTIDVNNIKKFCHNRECEQDEFSDLMITIDDDCTEIAKLFIQHPNINVNYVTYYGATALTTAIKKNNYEIIDLLMEHPNIDVNIGNKNPLYLTFHNMGPVEDIINHPSFDINSGRLLTNAVGNKNVEFVEFLLKQPNIDINPTDCYGNNPLMYINWDKLNTKEMKIIKLMLLHPKIDIYHKNHDGFNIFDAYKSCHTTISKIYISQVFNQDIASVVSVYF